MSPTGDTAPLSALVVAGTHSGVGKTTVTLGLIVALQRRGLTVQPFKVGPDFIDPLHHAHISGRAARNLDSWMLSAQTNRALFARNVADADVAIVEGVMGLFDGSEGSSDRGSTAEIAKMLDLPVILVVDAGAMARSAAAVIHGFATFDPNVRVSGVIVNNVGGEAHAEMIRDAIGNATPVLGALELAPGLTMPERHLGLHLPHELRDDFAEQCGDLIEKHVDVDAVLETTRVPRPASAPARHATRTRARVGVARDDAFCFYYADNLELLEDAGAEIVEFSPLADDLPDQLDGIYFGGGYPELHARELSRNQQMRESVLRFARSRGPIYAECGGLMYLANQLHVGDETYDMCRVLPFSTRIPSGLTIAYTEITTTAGLFGKGRTAKGHMFHHSAIASETDATRGYEIKTNRGETFEEGFVVDNVLASYVHLHFASSPDLAESLVDACARRRDRVVR